MKSFFLGLLGALLVVVTMIVLLPQYSDYRARAETEKWLSEVRPLQVNIEEAAFRKHALVILEDDVSMPKFSSGDISVFEVDGGGNIIIKGGRMGQVIVLSPSIDGEQITWRCIGGPSQAVPNRCDGNE